MLSLFLSGAIMPLFVLGRGVYDEVVMMVALGLAWGLTGPMAAWAADLAPPGHMGAAMGIFRMVGDVGWLVGPVAVGATAEIAGRTSPLPFLVAATVTTCTGILLIWARDPVGRRATQGGPPSAAVEAASGDLQATNPSRR